MNKTCDYCNNKIIIVNNITSYCKKCDLIYIKEHNPYSLYYDYELYYNDKYEEYINNY